jgi:hypothetical protein
MLDRHIARYGGNNIERGYCENCKTTALIIDDVLQCCDTKLLHVDSGSLSVYQLSEYPSKRKRIPLHVKKLILELQGDKCFYCGTVFGTYYIVNSHTGVKQTSIQYDHIVPFVTGCNNDHNIVAACNLCNMYKGAKVFNDLSEIILYCRKRILDKITFL